jgi:hypothetical protein
MFRSRSLPVRRRSLGNTTKNQNQNQIIGLDFLNENYLYLCSGDRTSSQNLRLIDVLPASSRLHGFDVVLTLGNSVIQSLACLLLELI